MMLVEKLIILISNIESATACIVLHSSLDASLALRHRALTNGMNSKISACSIIGASPDTRIVKISLVEGGVLLHSGRVMNAVIVADAHAAIMRHGFCLRGWGIGLFKVYIYDSL